MIKLAPQGVPVFTLLLAPEEWVSPRQSIKGSGVGIYSITISRLSVSILFYSRSACRASTACAMDVNERILHLQIYK